MKKTLYLECYSGISGDMTVGALLDLGADGELLKEQLKSLPIEGYEIEIKHVKKSGLNACDFCVILDKAHENHDHDNEYLYGTGHSGGSGHLAVHMYDKESECQENHAHYEGHSHGGPRHDVHFHGHTHHEHRGLPEILDIIRSSQITDRAKQTASDIFRILAEAEAKAHGTTIEEVHFHEVGAIDSIVDIVAAAVCLDNLGITDVIVPELYEGKGVVRCQHGLIPIPVPATANIAQAHGITLHMTDTEAELVTPTGAAIAAAVRTSGKLPDKYRLIKTGLGAGKRDYGRTSVLRAMLIEADKETSDAVIKLESNIDDCTGEALGFVMEQLLEAGARDVHYIPVFMKKNRPAYQLNVICGEELVPRMEEIIFRGTTTIGIRKIRMERTVLGRDIRTVKTLFGEARIKICMLGDERRIYPEYESVTEICRKTGLSYQKVFDQICQDAADLQIT